jgi:hypothetical protein
MRKTVIAVTNCNVLWYDISLEAFNLSTLGAMDKYEILNHSKRDKPLSKFYTAVLHNRHRPDPPPPGFRKLQMSKIQFNIFIYYFTFTLNTVWRTKSKNRIIPNATCYDQNPAEGTFWWLALVGLRFSTLDFDYDDDYDNNNDNNTLQKQQYWVLHTYYGKY